MDTEPTHPKDLVKGCTYHIVYDYSADSNEGCDFHQLRYANKSRDNNKKMVFYDTRIYNTNCPYRNGQNWDKDTGELYHFIFYDEEGDDYDDDMDRYNTIEACFIYDNLVKFYLVYTNECPCK